MRGRGRAGRGGPDAADWGLSDIMKKQPPLFLIIAVVVALLFGLYYAKYYGSLARDSVNRSWAYGTGDQLLVGKWDGSFRDPAGVVKELTIEVLLPVTDEQRAARASERRRKRTREDLRAFDGTAVVESQLGTETYEIYGWVDANVERRFAFDFRPEDESKRVLPNYTLARAANGGWQGDTLTAKLRFVHHDVDGVARTSSESTVVDGKLVDVEKPEDQPVDVTLTRVP